MWRTFFHGTAHTARDTHKPSFEPDINILPLPANCPDLNLIKKLPENLVRDVYMEHRPFRDVKELKERRPWDNID